jgi:hypothetical protein
MDGHDAVLLFILEWVWVPLGLIVMWTIKRLLGLEKTVAASETLNRVLEANTNTLFKKVDKLDERNTAEHDTIGGKIDKHHDRIMRRLDTLTTLTRNGGK